MVAPVGDLRLQDLSDELLVNCFSRLGTTYVCRKFRRRSGKGQPVLSNIASISGVCSRFRRLALTEVSETVLVDDTSLELLDQCPLVSERLFRGCKKLVCAPGWGNDLRGQKKLFELIGMHGNGIQDVTVQSCHLVRSHMQILMSTCQELQAITIQQCTIDVDTESCPLMHPPSSLRHLNLRGTVLVQSPCEAHSCTASHFPPAFFAGLSTCAPQLETLILPPLRYLFPVDNLVGLIPRCLLCPSRGQQLEKASNSSTFPSTSTEPVHIHSAQHPEDLCEDTCVLEEPGAACPAHMAAADFAPLLVVPVAAAAAPDPPDPEPQALALSKPPASDASASLQSVGRFYLPRVVVVHLSHLTRLELPLHSTMDTMSIGSIAAGQSHIAHAPPSENLITALFSSLPALRDLHVSGHPRHEVRASLECISTCSHLSHLSISRCMLGMHAQRALAERVLPSLTSLRTLAITDSQIHTHAAVNGHGGNMGVASGSSALAVLPKLTHLEHLCLNLESVIWVTAGALGGGFGSPLQSVQLLEELTRLTALHLAPCAWPDHVVSEPLKLQGLALLRHLSLPTPQPSFLVGRSAEEAFGSFAQLESVNCCGLKVPRGAVAALHARNPDAPVWGRLVALSALPGVAQCPRRGATPVATIELVSETTHAIRSVP